MASVELKNIVKSYTADKEVIPNLSLDMEEGQFTVLVGPSGCGKSTLLRIIAGLESVSAGEVTIGGKIVNDIPPRERDIAMVFQNYALYPHMNVYDNMAFGLKLRKVAKSEIDKQVMRASEILEIGDLLKRKPKELSGGQRQRVALGRAIVRNPLVFLFDEPLSNLDAKLRVQMRAQIKKLHNDLKTTMIYVTHDQVEAMTMGDRIVIMKDGIIQQIGSPMQVYSKPANIFVGGFIGSPAMNFIKGTISGGKFHSNGMEIKTRKFETAIKDGMPVVLGIRPEDIIIRSGAIATELIVSEPLGSETILHLKLEDNIIIAKCDGIAVESPGSPISIELNEEGLHYFEDKNGLRIE